MRFIGNKTNLLENIKEVIKENCGNDNQVFCDIFSGTGSVGRFFKKDYKIVANDLLYFSHILCAATLEVNEIPKFNKLKAKGIEDVLSYLETKEITNEDVKFGFFTENYSPAGKARRMYLSESNARRIDFIRESIDRWKISNLIDDKEFKYLLACLIESVPFVSNITGTYGAYLKTWDKRALKKLELVRLGVSNNYRDNLCYNKDANKLIKEIEGDILYIDPPYNNRQYLPNYHVLETIAKNDRPELNGVTGVRPYTNEKSSRFST